MCVAAVCLLHSASREVPACGQLIVTALALTLAGQLPSALLVSIFKHHYTA
jgi:hypothetical protein